MGDLGKLITAKICHSGKKGHFRIDQFKMDNFETDQLENRSRGKIDHFENGSLQKKGRSEIDHFKNESFRKWVTLESKSNVTKIRSDQNHSNKNKTHFSF